MHVWSLIEIGQFISEKSGNIVIVRNGGHFEMAAILKISKVECTPLSDALFMCEISGQYLKAWRKKMRKTDFLRYSKSKKGHNSLRKWRNPTKHKLDLRLITTKPYTKFQLNTSKHDKKKCGKLTFNDILSPKRGITHSEIDGIRRNANLICGSSLQSRIQNFSSILQSMRKKSADNCSLRTRRKIHSKTICLPSKKGET